MGSLPALTPEQQRAHVDFAWLRITLSQLESVCRPLIEFSFTPTERRFTGAFQLPQPGIPFTRAHIDQALSRRLAGSISERDLVIWSTFILLNDAYELDPADEDVIADWLNDVSFGSPAESIHDR